MALTGSSIASTYLKLLRINTDTMGADATASYIQDSADTDSALSISTTRCGIGTATPDSALEVNGSVKFTNGADNASSVSYDPTAEGGAGVLYAYNLDLTSGGRLRSPVNADLTLQQHGSASNIIFNIGGANEKVRIDSSGNVGIGTAAPTMALSLYDSTELTLSNGGGAFYIGNEGGANVVFDRGGLQSRENGGASNLLLNELGGNVGIGTTAPGQLLDVNSGGGNMIADGYDTHSLAVYKENIEDASGYLDKVLACPAQKWNRKPFVSADEIKEAVLEEFGEDVLIEEAVEAQDAVLDEDGNESEQAIEAKDAVYEKQYSVWDELFPEDNSHRQKALYNMPDGDLKT